LNSSNVYFQQQTLCNQIRKRAKEQAKERELNNNFRCHSFQFCTIFTVEYKRNLPTGTVEIGFNGVNITKHVHLLSTEDGAIRKKGCTLNSCEIFGVENFNLCRAP
jgi:hypothetical protein